MISEVLQRQIDQWLDGDLSSDEQDRLKESLEQIPEAMVFLSDRALLHAMLSKSIAWGPSSSSVVPEPSLPAPLPVGSLPEPNRWYAHTWIWASSATVVCLLLISILFLPSVFASPVDLVQKTLIEYRAPIDRCYTVKVEADARLGRNKLRGRPGQSDSKLWVRDNSFVQIFDSLGDSLVWGRGRQGSVWFTIAGKSAAIFQAGEIPETLEELCDLRTLDITTLLESLLRDYDLRFTGRTDRLRTIFANPRPGVTNSKYGAIEIEIDPQSRLVHRVTLERLKDQRPVATVSFVLEEIQPRDESFYNVRSHLQDDADVMESGTRFGKRSELLREFLLKLRLSNASRIK